MALDIYKALTEEPPGLDFVLPSLLCGSVGALISPGGVGKSMWALQLAVQISGGADLLGFGGIKTGSVVYLPAEDPDEILLHRLHSISSYLTEQQIQLVSDNLCIQSLVGHSPNILDSRWQEALESIACGSRLLIIDTLRRFHVEDENSSSAMARVLAGLENIAHRTKCTIVFVHHTNKLVSSLDSSMPQQSSRGSSVLVDNIRWQAYLSIMSEKEAKRLQIHESQRELFIKCGLNKANYGPGFSEKWLVKKKGGFLELATFGSSSKVTGIRREKA
ncbi:helicase RepA family protein [Neptunomonas phycophila]|uniref:Helicase RepA family protein n=1 Tax=Neptunomonas phycophila TaxID=1572645 RepID=A0AAW7XN23_9GAMM|nr:helicase RepA family protein [Neptunomonas phycophila]MDO6454402.1 helicase RepA family protein [Neptunomonas phycophila]